MMRALRWLFRPAYSPWMLIYLSNLSTGLVLAWVAAFAVFRTQGEESIPVWMLEAFLAVFGVALVDIIVSTIVMRRRNKRIGMKATMEEAEKAWLRRDHERVVELLSPIRNHLDWVLTWRLIAAEKRCRDSRA